MKELEGYPVLDIDIVGLQIPIVKANLKWKAPLYVHILLFIFY